jgi:hypothetical protein|tara:strand:+ start:415 stop:717 length:303 start_codon:yes stop_codon:yes gene_type:complete
MERDGKEICMMTTLNVKVEKVLQNQIEVQEDITMIKEAVYNPDSGLYSRLKFLENTVIRDGELRIATVEQTVNTIKKIQWMVIGSAVMTLTALMIKFVLA